jgi:hypothetical protein
MVVNDSAHEPDKRGALESIAGKPAPTGMRYRCFPGLREVLFYRLFFFERRALRYSKANEAKPNNPIIEMIMIPNSELCMLISG